MKKMKTALALLVFTLCLTFLSATPVQAKVALNKTSLTLLEGQSATLKLTGTKKKVTWKSSNKAVAAVSKKGKVTAKSAGTATISAKSGNKTKKCKVTVTVDYSKMYEYQIKYGKVTINKLLRISDAALVIPETIEGCPVSELADGLFKNCDGLVTVTLPSGVSAIGDSMFYGCSTLREVNCSALSALGAYAFFECSALETLPDLSGITEIGDYTFYNCDALQTLTFPALKHIGAYAFYDCDQLLTFFGPGTMLSIGDYAFKGCDALISATGNKNVQSFGTECFADCKKLTNVSCSDNLTVLGTGCFSGCETLNSVSLSGTLTMIPDRCFYNCYAITSMTIPASVSKIGSMAFFNCIRLTTLTIPGTAITNIAADAFAGVPPASLHIYYRSTGSSSYIESWAKSIGVTADHMHTI